MSARAGSLQGLAFLKLLQQTARVLSAQPPANPVFTCFSGCSDCNLGPYRNVPCPKAKPYWWVAMPTLLEAPKRSLRCGMDRSAVADKPHNRIPRAHQPSHHRNRQTQLPARSMRGQGGGLRFHSQRGPSFQIPGPPREFEVDRFSLTVTAVFAPVYLPLWKLADIKTQSKAANTGPQKHQQQTWLV
jgi:hypothetical protein